MYFLYGITPDCWNYEVDSKNQSIHFNFKETVKARFIKIRTIWDDRDIDNNNVSEYVTFTNESVQKMIRIWTIENSKDEFYRYDKNSNRITLETYTTKNDYAYYKNADNGNTARVMYDGKWWYTYDANGNRTARARNAEHNGNVVNIDKSDEYWEYEWDYHNRLVKVQQHNAPDNAQNVKVEYTYDAMNRRIERISYTGETSELTQYAYGRNGALTYQEKTAGSSVTTRSFVYLNNQIAGFVDKLQNGSEKTYYTITDIQGSVTEVYDESQNLVWKSGYTAFGILACEVSNLIDFDGLYTGCDYDSETGLTYHWNRWRSEEGNSWLSEDFARDGLNWYGYAGQNPIMYSDSTGLYSPKLFDIVPLAYSLITNGEKLGKNNSSSDNSLYQQQYTSLAEDKQTSGDILGLAGGLPIGGILQTSLMGMSLYSLYSDASDTIVTDPESFISGAEKEILRLNSAIESLKDNKENEDFIEFLQKQKEALREEINSNKNYSKNKKNDTCYSDIFGRKVDPPAHDPKSGIDYKKAYEKSKEIKSNEERKKNEKKLDE